MRFKAWNNNNTYDFCGTDLVATFPAGSLHSANKETHFEMSKDYCRIKMHPKLSAHVIILSFTTCHNA